MLQEFISGGMPASVFVHNFSRSARIAILGNKKVNQARVEKRLVNSLSLSVNT